MIAQGRNYLPGQRIIVDIEGAEKELFSSKDCREWINNCSVISCELHDHINSKVYTPGCTEALENALKYGNFIKKISGQYNYYINQNRLI